MKLVIDDKEYNIVYADSFKKKLLGLMGQKNISYGMYFPKTNSIHTFFMRENIDVIALDKDNVIVYINANMKKNRIFIAPKKTSILELPLNASKNLKIGQKLTFISK